MYLEAPNTSDGLVRLPLETRKYGYAVGDIVVDYLYESGVALTEGLVQQIRQEAGDYADQYLRTTETMIAEAVKPLATDVRITHGTYTDPWYVYLRPRRRIMRPHEYHRLLTVVTAIWEARMRTDFMLIELYAMADRWIKEADNDGLETQRRSQ